MTVALALLAVGVVVAVFFRAAILTPVAFRPVDLAGKTIVMAGGTSGIGLEAARRFASWNATVVIGSRSRAKGERVSADLLSTLPPESTGSVNMLDLDLASFASVKEFATTVRAAYKNIDVLALNAGMHGKEHVVLTRDGNEETYQTNFLSHYLLTSLLLPVLRSTPGARIVHTSSAMHYLGSLDHSVHDAHTRNADSATARCGIKSYCDTKLMNVVYSNWLDRTEPDVSSVATHPGLVSTDLDRNQPALVAAAMRAIRRATSRPASDGAVTLVTAATLEDPAWARGSRNGRGVYLEDQCIMNECVERCSLCYHVEADPGGGMRPHAISDDVEEQEWLVQQAKEIVAEFL
jgi:NAD(P)-dependent dehydrogenase (short-subunit alcohol dehydrogenase family)